MLQEALPSWKDGLGMDHLATDKEKGQYKPPTLVGQTYSDNGFSKFNGELVME